MLAPMAEDIMWENIGHGSKITFGRRILFGIILLSLFVAYVYGQTLIMGLINGQSESWTILFFEALDFNNDC